MGDSLPTVALGTGRTAVAITAGNYHTCALLDDGSVKCWGYNDYGQLGLGDTADRGVGAGEMGDSLPAVALGTGRTAVAITSGSYHTCALLDDASVKCWGLERLKGSWDWVTPRTGVMVRARWVTVSRRSRWARAAPRSRSPPTCITRVRCSTTAR